MNCPYCYLRFFKEARALFVLMIVRFVYDLCTVHVQFKGIAKRLWLAVDIQCMYSVCTVYVQFIRNQDYSKEEQQPV